MQEDGTSGGLRTASLTAVAGHWAVHPDTARRLLRAQGAAPVGGRRRWAWDDVWRAEGLARVHPMDRAALRRPLLTAEACAARDPLARSVRSWRRYLAEGRLPVVRLDPGIRRVREADLADWAERV